MVAMEWSAVGALAELVGATAVVVSLLYLAAQLRRGAEQQRVESARTLVTGVAAHSMNLSADETMADIWLRGCADPDTLAPLDELRFRTYLNSMFKMFEQQFVMHERGLLDSEDWETMDAVHGDFVQMPGIRAYFAARGHWYRRSYVDYLKGKGLPQVGRKTAD
jgi:hypothetical protein